MPTESPESKLHDMIDIMEALGEGCAFVSLDQANAQSRGIGTLVSFWERMRSIFPKFNSYHGPILGGKGNPCKTSKELDEAMLDTRQFWFETPTSLDNGWDSILSEYDKSPKWPAIPPPGRVSFLSTLLHERLVAWP